MGAQQQARILARGRISARTDRMIELVSSRDSNLLEKLSADPVPELERWPDLQVAYVDTSELGDGCSIAGTYRSSSVPPQIALARDAGIARTAFTALHELGHHLQRTDDLLVNDLPSQPDRGKVLEEQTSDAFAARVLLPNELVLECLGPGTATAAQIARLWQASTASRAAVCVRAAQQLASPGHVLLLDSEGRVAFSSSYAEFPLKRGSDQSTSRIFSLFRNSIAGKVAATTRFTYRDGIQGAELYAQAISMGGFTLVVAVVDAAPWEQISLSSKGRPVLSKWRTCGQCGELFTTWDVSCDICKTPQCPECGRCDCPSRVRERECVSCHMIQPAHLFVGSSTTCVDC